MHVIREREKPSLFLVTVLPSTQMIDYRSRKNEIAEKMIRQFRQKTKLTPLIHAKEIMPTDARVSASSRADYIVC